MEYRNYSDCVLKRKKEKFRQRIDEISDVIDDFSEEKKAEELEERSRILKRKEGNAENYDKAGDTLSKKNQRKSLFF